MFVVYRSTTSLPWLGHSTISERTPRTILSPLVDRGYLALVRRSVMTVYERRLDIRGTRTTGIPGAHPLDARTLEYGQSHGRVLLVCTSAGDL